MALPYFSMQPNAVAVHIRATGARRHFICSAPTNQGARVCAVVTILLAVSRHASSSPRRARRATGAPPSWKFASQITAPAATSPLSGDEVSPRSHTVRSRSDSCAFLFFSNWYWRIRMPSQRHSQRPVSKLASVNPLHTNQKAPRVPACVSAWSTAVKCVLKLI